MKMYETTQSVEKYLNVKLECSCGRTHYAPIKDVDVFVNKKVLQKGSKKVSTFNTQ